MKQFEDLDVRKIKQRKLPYFIREAKPSTSAKENIPESEQILWVYQSEFHYYIVRPDCISIINLISDKLVEHKKVLLADQFPNVFKFFIEIEGNDSWNLQLEKKNFKEAYELSKRFRPEFTHQIAAQLAFQMFEARQYTEAAELYSTIQMPFERILLLYLDKVDDDVDAQYGFISRLD